MLEVARDFFLADPDAGREFASRVRALPEYLPERRPYRFVSLDSLVWAWPFRQRVHLRSLGSCGIRSYNNTLDALDTPISVGGHLDPFRDPVTERRSVPVGKLQKPRKKIWRVRLPRAPGKQVHQDKVNSTRKKKPH